MRQLMISLDKKILDPNSAVARRMVEYGKEIELFIIIPDKKKQTLDLSPAVHAQSTGGNKLLQFFNLKKIGKEIIGNWKLSCCEDGILFAGEIGNCLITVQDPFFTGLAGVWLKRKTGIKLEVQMHGDFFSEYYKKQWFRQCLARWVVRRADKVRVVGERIKRSLSHLGVTEDKIIVRPVPIDVEYIKNHQPKIDLHKKYPGYEKIFLVLGRLELVKNIFWLIKIFAEVVKQKNYLLLIVGNGQCLANLQSEICNLKLSSKIKFEPWTNDPYSYLKTADCILFSSLSEGYGMVPMEANAAGTTVIMNDVGVANFELKPSEKVRILPVNDKEMWIKAISEV